MQQTCSVAFVLIANWDHFHTRNNLYFCKNICVFWKRKHVQEKYFWNWHFIDNRENFISTNIFFKNNRHGFPKYTSLRNSFDSTHFWSKNHQGRYIRLLTVQVATNLVPRRMQRSQYWSKMRKKVQNKGKEI